MAPREGTSCVLGTGLEDAGGAEPQGKLWVVQSREEQAVRAAEGASAADGTDLCEV